MQKMIRRGYQLIHGIVSELASPGAAPKQIDLCVASIVGQCLFYNHARHVISPALRQIDLTPAGIDEVARHIADFSLAGLTHRAAPSGT